MCCKNGFTNIEQNFDLSRLWQEKLNQKCRPNCTQDGYCLTITIGVLLTISEISS